MDSLEPSNIHLSLIEPVKKKETLPVLVTVVDRRCLGPMISVLKQCPQCQLPYNCPRVRKDKTCDDSGTAELCICIGSDLVPAVVEQWSGKCTYVGPNHNVVKTLRVIEAAHKIQLTLATRVLGDTWPTSREAPRPTVESVVSPDEMQYVRRCIASLTGDDAVVVASPTTGFFGVFRGSSRTTANTDSGVIPDSKADILQHPIHTAIKEAMRATVAADSAYLLTGYDVFTVKEPCIFCSMCLLHVRVHRVFYTTQLTQNGGLNQGLMIPALPGVNHRFPVLQYAVTKEHEAPL